MPAQPPAPAEPMQVDPVRDYARPVRTPPFTPRRKATSARTRPTVVEMVEESTFFLDVIAVGAPTLPGFLLTVPGLALFVFPVILIVVLPVLVVGLLAAAVGLAVLLALVPLLVARRVARRTHRVVVSRRALRPEVVARRPRSAAEPTVR